MSAAGRRPKGERAGGRLVLLVLLVIALLGGGAYAGAYVVAGENVPRGTSVAGVDIGGRPVSAAAQELQRGLSDRTARPLAITIGAETREIAPADLGLSVDYEASVAGVGGGRSWRPRTLWDYFTGGRALEPVVVVDEGVLDKRLRALGRRATTAPVDGAVAFVDGAVSVTDPVAGSRIDDTAASALLSAAYLDDDPAVTLPLLSAEPDIDAADVQLAVTSFANPAISAPVTLDFGSTPVRLQPRDFASALSMAPQDGVLVPQLDDAKLSALVATATADSGAPVDASVRIVKGRAKVTKAKPGVTYAPETITASFLDLLSKPDGQRELAVTATVAEPAVSTADVRALKIKRRVSTFTTTFPYAEYRNTNIGRAADLIDQTVLAPGETFSLNDTVGERTRENGFTDGFVINDGILVEDLGGGVSQLATTTFNAMFFAGLQDVEHKPHSFYIDRYPVGREATVAWGAIDLRFKDDSPYGVLIDAKVTPSTPSTPGVVTVSMWSTKVWDIDTSTGPRTNPTSPQTRTLDTADCYPNTGYGGFDIEVVRDFRKAGDAALDHQETFRTTYTPSDTVICTPPPAASSAG